MLDLDLGRTEGPGWVTLAGAVDELATWHVDLGDRLGDVRAAASFLSGWVAGAPALVVGLPALVAGVAVDVGADGVLLHRAVEGHVDRYGLVGADQTASDAVLAAAASAVARLSLPVVARTCEVLPVGPVALWGGVADTLAAYALWFSRQTAGDGAGMWARVDRFLGHLREHAPLRYAPRFHPVRWSQGTSPHLARVRAASTTGRPPRRRDGSGTAARVRSWATKSGPRASSRTSSRRREPVGARSCQVRFT